jgi:hypothetical protein
MNVKYTHYTYIRSTLKLIKDVISVEDLGLVQYYLDLRTPKAHNFIIKEILPMYQRRVGIKIQKGGEA